MHAFMDHDLMLVTMPALYSTEQFPRATEKWEDMSESEKTWAKWKSLYKSAEAKEKVRLQATGGKDQFGVAHYSGKGNLVPFVYVPPASAAAANTGPPEGARGSSCCGCRGGTYANGTKLPLPE